MRRSVVALVVVAALALAAPPVAVAAPPRTSLYDVEGEVMCVLCGVPLNVADSAQADRERELVVRAIARGETKAQVERDLVAQYGPAVLGLPARRGFDLAAYLVPAGAVAVLLALLAATVPRWRRRGGGEGAIEPEAPDLTAADALRLERDLARFEG